MRGVDSSRQNVGGGTNRGAIDKDPSSNTERRNGFDSSFAAQLAFDVATNSKVKTELERANSHLLRKEKVLTRDTDWNEIVRKQLFRDYNSKKPGGKDNESRVNSNRSSSPFSLRHIDSKGQLQSRPFSRAGGLTEQLRPSLVLGNYKEDPLEELLIGAAKGKNPKRNTSELVRQLYNLKEEIKQVTDLLEREIQNEARAVSQQDSEYILACEQVYMELQGPGQQDLEMRIVNFSEELEEIKQSKIPSVEQTLRYLEQRKQQITALINSVSDELITEQARSIISRIEEFQKVKNRAVENITSAEKSLNRVE